MKNNTTKKLNIQLNHCKDCGPVLMGLLMTDLRTLKSEKGLQLEDNSNPSVERINRLLCESLSFVMSSGLSQQATSLPQHKINRSSYSSDRRN